MLQKIKRLLVVGVAALSLALVVPNMANAGGAFLGNAQAGDTVEAYSGDSFDFLGQSAGFNSGATVETKAAAGSLFNRRAVADTKETAIGGMGDKDLYLPGFLGFGYKPGVGLTHTIGSSAEGTGMGYGSVYANACGLLSGAYGSIKITAWQENWSNAENHNLLDWNGDFGQASAYNTSTATSETERLDVGIISASVRLCDLAVTHGETFSWVTVGNNYAQSGAFSGNNYGIGDKLSAQGQVQVLAVATNSSGYGAAQGSASFSGSDGFASSLGTVNATGGIIKATAHSHAEAGGGSPQ